MCSKALLRGRRGLDAAQLDRVGIVIVDPERRQSKPGLEFDDVAATSRQTTGIKLGPSVPRAGNRGPIRLEGRSQAADDLVAVAG